MIGEYAQSNDPMLTGFLFAFALLIVAATYGAADERA
jgi:hypothetical protein